MEIIGEIKSQRVTELFRKLIANGQDTRPAMQSIAQMMLESVRQNFESEGRPVKWKPWKDATRKARARRGTVGGKILRDRGDLARSVVSKYSAHEAVVGSSLPYALTHDQGDADRGIPQREFMLFQKEDIIEAEAILTRRLMRGVK